MTDTGILDRIIDRIDTYCLSHAWVPSQARVAVGKLWQRRFGNKTSDWGCGQSDCKACY